MILASFSMIGMALGAYLACRAERYGSGRKSLETVAGLLLIFGIGLAGYGLKKIIGSSQASAAAAYKSRQDGREAPVFGADVI